MMKTNEKPEQTDGQVQPDLDKILTELATVLQHFGVEEYFMSQVGDAQSHVIDRTYNTDHKLLTLFAIHIHALYQELVTGEG
ncbi:hypothetical protein [Taibaiella soli]|uniref:Uncharacterized protein n=1 Tax=Taibaiella soli TaxID=1649169 RepID=A0A2W2B4B4_9BACT|nr:hypothetical protein [Taibaiella soli]PZF70977.1 hypothetical protein DN068_19925 [Taibaiella soli]